MSENALSSMPRPPYYAVIFSSQRTAHDDAAYGAAAQRMVELARTQPGFLGVESARGADGFGITVSYWDSEDAIAAWRNHAEHAATRERGRREWYAGFDLRVAKVERAYGRSVPATPARADAP
ncbi:antibiotic biosynthesis monooxygenase family protein [Chiayiivirga flava]|uniref:Heme-degrading monooxygenase HmoA n=1 Tax=Chiayiivirga flava TaxID=659595 RepID=A0A7W8G210_9GAMM|nr:antibiotic biosynthesis monooxygenase [Chiayiivirga flava]MBB5208190.1 heme-degrading monooxygenase HmoA [Chiayiivirga flava]